MGADIESAPTVCDYSVDMPGIIIYSFKGQYQAIFFTCKSVFIRDFNKKGKRQSVPLVEVYISISRQAA